jgi:serine/threonine protein kinase
MVSNASAIEFDLLSRCLVYDPALRMSAENILQRPYFTQTGSEREHALAGTLGERDSGISLLSIILFPNSFVIQSTSSLKL